MSPLFSWLPRPFQQQQQQQTITCALFPIAAVGQNKPQGGYLKKHGVFVSVTETSFLASQAIPYRSWADLGGGCRGCAPPPWDDLRFSNTTGILQKKTTWFFFVVEVEQETSAPPPKKNPGSPLQIVHRWPKVPGPRWSCKYHQVITMQRWNAMKKLYEREAE